ncbi:autotransporter-associated beta strand repeat-containing protein, partial [Shewanella sp. A3A]|nr:autotransporter-associated beta strand repeat-containing protein [Shewanella ferrihydritica]
AGGFKFDSNGFDVAIVQGLSGVGSVTKLGEGALTLSGVGSYAGDTIVEEGVLILTQVGVLNDASTVRLETMESLVLAHGGTET